MDNNLIDPEYVPSYIRKSDDMSVGAWLGTLILSAIPVVGFICMIVWAVSGSGNKRSRKNWAIAQFILMFIGILLTAALIAVYGQTFLRILRMYY